MLISASTPYCGFKRKHDGGQLYVPRSAAHVLVSAPSGGEQSTAVSSPRPPCSGAARRWSCRRPMSLSST